MINALMGKRNKLTFWCRWQLLPGKKDGSIQQGSEGRARIPAKLTRRGSIWEALMKISPGSAHHLHIGNLKLSLSPKCQQRLGEQQGAKAGAAEPGNNIETWGS